MPDQLLNTTPPPEPSVRSSGNTITEAVALFEQAHALYTLSIVNPEKYKPQLVAVELELLAVVQSVTTPVAMVRLLRQFTQLTAA